MRAPRTPAPPSPRHRAAVVAALTLGVLAIGAVPSASAASSTVTRCGTIAVPGAEARAAVSLRGTRLPCRTVRRVVHTAYERSVLLGDTRPFTVRDAGRSFRCRYTPSSGGMVCEAPGRRLRGTI